MATREEMLRWGAGDSIGGLPKNSERAPALPSEDKIEAPAFSFERNRIEKMRGDKPSEPAWKGRTYEFTAPASFMAQLNSEEVETLERTAKEFLGTVNALLDASGARVVLRVEVARSILNEEGGAVHAFKIVPTVVKRSRHAR